MIVVMKQQVLDGEVLCTMMSLDESIINGRLLTLTSDDVRDPDPPTQNHLLRFRQSNTLPPDLFQGDSYGRRRWIQVQCLADLLWRRTREQPRQGRPVW